MIVGAQARRLFLQTLRSERPFLQVRAPVFELLVDFFKVNLLRGALRPVH